MEIKTTNQILDDNSELPVDYGKKWIKIDDEFIEFMRQLKSFMRNGYGEHKDFRNMGTDYEGRSKVFQQMLDIYKETSPNNIKTNMDENDMRI